MAVPPPPPPYENDPDFLAELAKIRSEAMSGPYSEHLIRIFHRCNEVFQLSISQLQQLTAQSHEAMVLLRPPLLDDASSRLSVLFHLQLPAQESHWSSAHTLPTGTCCSAQACYTATRRGMLIDFDAALDTSAARQSNNNVAGTLEYMAVGLAREQGPHTYRHDLESLFYVLLHAVASSCDGTLPATSRLARWASADD
ncbi:Protein kinase-like domain protein [Cordyceps fumosorosea ARSEF 2679]|uniref:Protein kinase-like domain protein n=1 Tax=Cordyceps fumosorosea (strain ARSEF 2679) TaxID=1081104 RepID=A0A167N451_CORFA|nr:Protein kinase-like domain protein [Cordyceps fumosorosea ARSEF 2679]OAA55109.1 Protein kinase-like domain protein [Cordyceps fumosorosea ARSEF 2679]